jgi:hypothetical protein
MAVIRSKFSERQAGAKVAIDVLAMSPQARLHAWHLAATSCLPVVQNTTKTLLMPVAADLKVTSVYIGYTTIPICAGGTAVLEVDYVAVDGSTTTIIGTMSVLALSSKIPAAMTLAATNPAKCAAGGSLVFTMTTSNNAVGTADVGGGLAIGIERVEAAVISDTNTTV